jgi:hypothetical protein
VVGSFCSNFVILSIMLECLSFTETRYLRNGLLLNYTCGHKVPSSYIWRLVCLDRGKGFS